MHLGSIHLGDTTLDTAGSNADYLFMSFTSFGTFSLQEGVTETPSLTDANTVFGPSNAIPYGATITEIDFTLTTSSNGNAGSTDPFTLFF